MNRRPLSVDLGLLEPLDSLSEPMADTARKITAESLHARLPVENPHDEFGRLAGVFNETLSRLDAAFEQLRHFTADASHVATGVETTS